MAKNKKKQAKTPTQTDVAAAISEEVPKLDSPSDSETPVTQSEENSETVPQTEQMANGHTESNGNAELQDRMSQLEIQIRERDEELAVFKSQNGTSKDDDLAQRLADAEKERDDAKGQLNEFLSKISSMKAVFRNFKATQEELEELKEEMVQLTAEKDQIAAEKAEVAASLSLLQSESGDLNSECDRLSQQLTQLRREYQLKDESLLDEKYALENEVSRLSKKIHEHKANYSELELAQEETSAENKNLILIIEELKGQLDTKDGEIKHYQAVVEDMRGTWDAQHAQTEAELNSKKSELEKLHKDLSSMKSEAEKAQSLATEKSAEIEQLKLENTKITQLQEEVHSKQLIVGKLRHEAIILNEHLTKSLSMLKQQLNNTNNTIDKELISNVLLNFLQIPRGDTKKFEALLLISALLEWDDARKVQAGLSHSIGSRSQEEGRPLRLNFVSLWTDFLEKESSKTTK